MSRYTTEECHLVVRQALDELIERDAFLISEMADERALTHRLGMYLQRLMFDMDVDCEYNRIGSAGKPKWLYDCDSYIRPDVIVHRRGTSENLIIIEAKKNSCIKMKDRTSDLERLERMTDRRKDYPYHYQIGYFIDFQVKSTSQTEGIERRRYFQTEPLHTERPDGDRVYEIRVKERR